MVWRLLIQQGRARPLRESDLAEEHGRYAQLMTSEVDVYDPCTNAWTTVAPIPTLRYEPAAALGPDRRIYVMGSEPTAAKSP
jgi:hypothetical protein